MAVSLLFRFQEFIDGYYDPVSVARFVFFNYSCDEFHPRFNCFDFRLARFYARKKRATYVFDRKLHRLMLTSRFLDLQRLMF